MNRPIFELSNINFSYIEGKPALKNINLKIWPGERVALIGANGSGKSTLLKILDGLVFPDSGEFVAFDQRANEETLEKGEFAQFFRGKVAFVFQDSDIQLFSSTVFEDLIFGPLQLGLSKEEAFSRAADLLEMLKIAHLKDRSPNQLSGGEKKRVAIATSLSTNPDVLLLDEPTNDLDPRSRVWFYSLIDSLAKAGKTIILSTQDLDLARNFADRTIVVSEDHEIVADGKTAEIIADTELLLSVNLIHEHAHYHDGNKHTHIHYHLADHAHKH